MKKLGAPVQGLIIPVALVGVTLTQVEEGPTISAQMRETNFTNTQTSTVSVSRRGPCVLGRCHLDIQDAHKHVLQKIKLVLRITFFF